MTTEAILTLTMVIICTFVSGFFFGRDNISEDYRDQRCVIKHITEDK